jgi:hypothetical protein
MGRAIEEMGPEAVNENPAASLRDMDPARTRSPRGSMYT